MLLELIKGIRKQSRLQISKSLSLVENDSKIGRKLLSELFKYTGNAYKIGITGPPGAGKSSLTNNLIKKYRELDKKVAVIAVDPSSPFTGGAVLGDRIRMTSHYSDKNVFVRSMASRGGQGGLARKAQEASEVFDAAGYDLIIYETVGVGQIELDIMQAADTVVVVLVPESGDEIQMLKAGLMEIGDIFAINKSDRPGSNKLLISLNNILSLIEMNKEKWTPKVIQTVASSNHGTEDLYSLINTHKNFIKKNGIYDRNIDIRYKLCISDLITEIYLDNFWNRNNISKLNRELKKEYNKRISPYDLAYRLKNER